jgi:hypothetical protein
MSVCHSFAAAVPYMLPMQQIKPAPGSRGRALPLTTDKPCSVSRIDKSQASIRATLTRRCFRGPKHAVPLRRALLRFGHVPGLSPGSLIRLSWGSGYRTIAEDARPELIHDAAGLRLRSRSAHILDMPGAVEHGFPALTL